MSTPQDKGANKSAKGDSDDIAQNLPPPLEDLYEFSARLQRVYKEAMTAIDTLRVLIDDNDVQASASVTERFKVDLYQLFVKVRSYNMSITRELSKLSGDLRNQVVDDYLLVDGNHRDVAIKGLKKLYDTVIVAVDDLISRQQQSLPSGQPAPSVVTFPKEVTDVFSRIASNVQPSAATNPISGEITALSKTREQLAWKTYQSKAYPYFDGSFDSYLEWSNVMEKSVLPTFKDLPDLAVLVLRDSLKGSPGSLALIKSIDGTTPNASSEILKLLKARYGSKTSMGHYYSSELKKIKPVQEGDFTAFNQFILSLDRIVQKIIKYDLTSFVEPGEVFRLHDCLPPSRRDGFTDIYGALTDDDSAHCIAEFLKYVKGLQPAVEKMCVNRGFLNPEKAKSKSMYTDSSEIEADSCAFASSTGDKSRSGVYKCELHRSDNHSLDSCSLFRDRTPRDRFDLCQALKLCKMCLSRHENSDRTSCPSSNVKCAHCQQIGHHTLLCFRYNVNQNDSPSPRSEYLGERSKSVTSKKKGPGIKPSNNNPRSSGYSTSLGHEDSVNPRYGFSGTQVPDGLVNVQSIGYGTSSQSEPLGNPHNGSPNAQASEGMSPPGTLSAYSVSGIPRYIYEPNLFVDPKTGNVFSSHIGGNEGQSTLSHKVVGTQEGASVHASASRSVTTDEPPTRLVRIPPGKTASSLITNPVTQHLNAHASSSYVTLESSQAQPKLQSPVLENSETDEVVQVSSVHVDSSVTESIESSSSDHNSHSQASGLFGISSAVVPTQSASLEKSQDGPVEDRPGTGMNTGSPPPVALSETEEMETDLEIISYSSEVQAPGLYSFYSVPFLKDRDADTLYSTEQMVKRRSSHPACYNVDTHLIFFVDDGSDSSFITRDAARRCGARILASRDLTMTTLQGSRVEKTELVSFTIVDIFGQTHNIVAYTRDFICKAPTLLDLDSLKQIFPNMDVNALQRPKGSVDVLLGADYYGLHAKQEITSCGNLSVMKGSLGVCLQGSHPSLTPYMLKSPTGHCISAKVTLVNASSSHSSCFQTSHRFVDSVLSNTSMPILSNDLVYETMPPLSYDTDVDDDPHPISTSLPLSIASHGAIEVHPVIETETVDYCVEKPKKSQVVIGPHDYLDVSDLQKNRLGGSRLVFDRISPVLPQVFPEILEQDSVHIDYGSHMTDTCIILDSTDSDPSNTTHAYAIKIPTCDIDPDNRIHDFIDGEEIAVKIVPECGGCRCGNCPIPGHTYSFREEQELRLVTEGLWYDAERCVWVTSYPWLTNPENLPNNYKQAYAVLKSTERVLNSDPLWKETYSQQIHEHETRGVCRKLSKEELSAWSGPVFYIAHMAIEQPKSETTPVRVVFNASQNCKGMSLNSCLAKGPDRYNTSLAGMLIRWREFLVCLIGDLRKMYNSVHLEPLEQHVHRFLWRDCEDREPDTYVMTRVSLGDRPSGTIAIVAKNLTAKKFSHIDADAAQTLITQAYVDDIIDSVKSFSEALSRSNGCDQIANLGGFAFKGWSYGGFGVPDDVMKSTAQRVLGVIYEAKTDTINFPPKLNFSERKRKIRIGPNLTPEDIPDSIPKQMSKREVLSQVMSIYDPLGILSPVTLQAKLLLRESFNASKDWDIPLPLDLQLQWKDFFVSLFTVGNFHYRRSVTPPDAIGLPDLIICSDGSLLSFGACAYIRYETSSGPPVTTLLMAKSRIAPKEQRTVPQLELNGAVLASRLKTEILSETRLQFNQVIHLVDSEIVLQQINSTATTFNVYTGVRVGEIQSGNKTHPSTWAWIPTDCNPADLCTRVQLPDAINPSSAWFCGPEFFTLTKEKWPMKFLNNKSTVDAKPDVSPECFQTMTGEQKFENPLFLELCKDFKNYQSLITVVARLQSAAKIKSFKGISDKYLTPKTRKQAEIWCIKQAQSKWKNESEVIKQFKTVPIHTDKHGLYVVSSRTQTVLKSPRPIILPPGHRFTHLALLHAHEVGCHHGRDRTSVRFRLKFYTSHLNRAATSACKSCVMCRRVKKVILQQKMGMLPPERLSPSPPFNYVVLDLFGPFHVRGEVNPRTTLKVWGVIFVCLSTRAVHIDLTQGYDTKSFIITFTRYASIRGYPEHVYADPGTQIQGAANEMQSLDLNKIGALSAKHGTTWSGGPADSPWYQGAAEALIKSTKNALNFSIGKSRLSPFELQTALYEVANLLNERPLGYMSPITEDISIITPNSLLLGRTLCANPGDYAPAMNLSDRVYLVESVVTDFWKHWTDHYAPTLVHQSKWLTEQRNLKVDDVVLIADRNVMKGEYKLGIISDTHPSRDGKIRRVDVTYKRYRVGEALYECQGSKDVTVQRSAQRLALLIPVEERMDLN